MNKIKPLGTLTRGLIAATVGALAGIGAAAVAVAAPSEPVWGLMLWGVPIGIGAGALTGLAVWFVVRIILLHTRQRNRHGFSFLASGLAAVLLAGTITYVSFASAGSAIAVPVTAAACALALLGAMAEYRYMVQKTTA